MANLASTDLTWSFLNDRQSDTNYGKRKKYISGKITVASGKTFPKAGVPMPAAGTVGLTRNLDYYILDHGSIDPTLFTTGTTTASGSSVLWSYSVSGNKLFAYHVKFASAVNLAIKRMVSGDAALKKSIIYVTAVGW